MYKSKDNIIGYTNNRKKRKKERKKEIDRQKVEKKEIKESNQGKKVSNLMLNHSSGPKAGFSSCILLSSFLT